MHSIERRAMENIHFYTLLNPERYESLDCYRSERTAFRESMSRLLPTGWTLLAQNGVWCVVKPPQPKMPDAGFKIHLSITPDDAETLLQATTPIFVAEQVCFKFLVDEQILDYACSHLWGRGSCGKFITVYPANLDQFKRLLRELHEATRQLTGPYILSDKRYQDSRILYYRYGGFKEQYRLNVFGEKVPILLGTDEQWTMDERLPYFVLPEGISDPFASTDDTEGEPLLKQRYKALSALGVSSKGGVYRCQDLETNRHVVVKEARPFVNRTRDNPHDAIACLKNEYRALQRLADTGLTPRPLDFFFDWEHCFLAMEFIEGKHLYATAATEEYSPILMTEPDGASLRAVCARLLSLARKLISGLRTIHECGVLVRDISPRNILFEPHMDRVTFVDFEAAYFESEDERSPHIPLYTPGFSTPLTVGDKPTPASDYLSLSKVLGDLLYPPTPFFNLAPQCRKPMLTHLAKERGIPTEFIELILGIGDQPEHIDELLECATLSLEQAVPPAPLAPLRDDTDLRSIVQQIGHYLIEQIHCREDPLDLPTDYRRFTTNPLSVAYGAAGIAIFLHRTRSAVPTIFRRALVTAAAGINADSHAPGLYVGSAGVAWALLELGLYEEAALLMDTAARSPLLGDTADLFYGTAGWGLTNLFFFHRLAEEKYLRQAIEAFVQIRSKLKLTEAGYYYENFGEVYHGLAHGAAGIGYFLLRLYQETLHEEYLGYARKLLDFDLVNAEEQHGHLLFHRSVNDKTYYPYWRIGSAGIGSVALRFYAETKDEYYLQASRKIAHYLAGKYTVFPTNFSGMGGIGNFFVDMYLHTGEESYRTEAYRFVDRIMLFAIEKGPGVAFPGEELVRISTDFGTGSAGTGSFIHRILTGEGIPFFDL